MAEIKMRTENVEFIEYCLRRVWTAAGGSEEHGAIIAHAIGFAHRQGHEKLNQGLGVYEVLDIALTSGNLDVTAVPEMVSEGPSWAVFDAKKSSGYYALHLMAETAMAKAKQHGISICFGGNHNDAGSFAAYAYMAWEQDMVAVTSNNTVPLTAPFGGMENVLSSPPFDAIIPSGAEAPLWASVKFAEFYDGDIAEAVLQNKPMKGMWLIDPETGELTDDATKYAKRREGYGRVWDYDWGGQIEHPRTYALNLWNEGMTAVINPLGIPCPELPDFTEFTEQTETTSVGGSYYLCIDPAMFGPIEAVKQRSDALVRTIHGARPRPGHSVRLPGEPGFERIRKGVTDVEVLENHWEPFFATIAGRYGLSEASLRADFAADGGLRSYSPDQPRRLHAHDHDNLRQHHRHAADPLAGMNRGGRGAQRRAIIPKTKTRTENVEFIEHCLKRVWAAGGGSDEHGSIIAHAIGFAHRQGNEKLNQGLGVYEVLDIALTSGNLDVRAVPEIVSEGPCWAVFDAKRSSGYYALHRMAETAIAKARDHGISLCFGSNHNDAGSFGAYAYMAWEQDMVAITSNNTPPLTAPFGGMENMLSVAPFDAIIPSGEEAPLWASVKLAEFYDADVADAVLQDKPMKGMWLIDPETGELTDDATKHAKPLPGRGRVWDYDWGGQIEHPRTYALNLWNEGMTAIVNPLGVACPDLPGLTAFTEQTETAMMGGSYYICIDPAVFGPIEKVKQRSDAFVRTIHASKPRPGHSVRLPGEPGFERIRKGVTEVEVLESHWEPFFATIAGRYGLTEASLRAEFVAAAG